MYSYEERLRAVELYLKYGRRMKATLRELGYPTKNALKAWCQEFEETGDIQAGYVRSKPKYCKRSMMDVTCHWSVIVVGGQRDGRAS